MPTPLTLPVRYTTRKPPVGSRPRPSHPLCPRAGHGALWTFAEGSGSVARDSVGGILATAAGGGLRWGVHGPYGRDLEFLASGGAYATIPNGGWATPGGAFAFSIGALAYLRSYGASGDQFIRTILTNYTVAGGNIMTVDFRVGVDGTSGNAGKLCLTGGTNNSFYWAASTTANVPLNTWVFLGATLHADHTADLFIGTAAQRGLSPSGDFGAVAQDWSLGCNANAEGTGMPARFWDGYLAGLIFHCSRDLTPGQMTSLAIAPYQMF